MRYCDLFHLNPIESVIKIAEADQLSDAQRLVSSFVVTPSLEDELTRVVIPMLDPASRQEGKGLFVVGNYGTGKSHLMSFISVVAEHADALSWLRDSKLSDALKPLAGKYLVKRHDLNVPDTNSVTLYHVIAEQLNLLAEQHGVHYRMRTDGVTDIKIELGRWMDAITEKHPDKYVLLVTDEVLDHLRKLNDSTRVRDLGMLRALGEFCDGRRLRFIAGVQQTLFERHDFKHVSDELQRIRQRYADVRIDNRGVEQLISTYLFEKTDAQCQQIRIALEREADLYPLIGHELERFVQLFPAHPSFLDEFQRVTLVERREILKVLTAEGRALADASLEDQPLQLITADRYWGHIEADPGVSSDADVRKTKQIAAMLTGKITQRMQQDDREGALRLLHALCVNRLSTPDKGMALGLTPDDLRDQLLWWADMPMRDAAFLAGAIKQTLQKVRDAANGQYLTMQGDQFYIDFDLDRDYELEARTRARQLAPDAVQRYLNGLLTSALEIDNTQPVQEGRLWNYSVKWVDRNVDRPGWLFFGYPNLRSTGKPPKDFYIFLCPSLRVQQLNEPFEPQEDESYWFFEDFPQSVREVDGDETQPSTWLDDLRLYAAHSQLAELDKTASDSPHRRQAKQLRQSLLAAFNEDARDWVSIQLGAERRPLRAWMEEIDPSRSSASFRVQFDCVSEWWFARCFAVKYPDYPKFAETQVELARTGNVRAAMETLSNAGIATKQGQVVLEALGLRVNDTDTTDTSIWIGKLRERFRTLKSDQYLNHSDLFEQRDERMWFRGECLEAEYLLVVLMAGVAAGEFVLYGKTQKQYDATRLEEIAKEIKLPDDVVRLGRPQEIPLDQWRKLFTVLGLKTGELAHKGTHARAIDGCVAACRERVQIIGALQARLAQPLPMELPRVAEDRQKLAARLQGPARVLEATAALNTPAKMRSLTLSLDDIETLGLHLQTVEAFQQILLKVDQWKPKLDAIERFRGILDGLESPFHDKAQQLVDALDTLYNDPMQLNATQATITRLVDDAVEAAVDMYRSLYKRARMDRAANKRHQTLTNNPKLAQLRQLAKIAILAEGELDRLITELERLKPAKEFTAQELVNSPNGLLMGDPFDPQNPEQLIDATERLRACEAQLDALLQQWTKQLLQELREEPMVKSGLDALLPNERSGIDALLETGQLPDPIDSAFITAMNQVTHGLKLKRVAVRDLASALAEGGMPVKLDDLMGRLQAWIQALAGTDDRAQIRVILED